MPIPKVPKLLCLMSHVIAYTGEDEVLGVHMCVVSVHLVSQPNLNTCMPGPNHNI
jgi:hypothetical protein